MATSPTPMPHPELPDAAMPMSYFVPPDFGDLLQQLLDEPKRQWSQRHFAELAGVSHTQVRRIIDGERTPDPEDLEKWAQIFKLDGKHRHQFIESGRSARAKGKADSSDYVQGLEKKLQNMERSVEKAEQRASQAIQSLGLASAIIDQLIAQLRQSGAKIPESVDQAATQIRDQVRTLDH